MTALEGILRGFIKAQGPLPVGAFMAHCLYHATEGYYTRGLNFAGLGEGEMARDFITAPEMTPLFGAVLARWVGETWRKLGGPVPFDLMEAGPGRGVLMRDILTYLQEDTACFAAARVVLVEVSPVLRGVQQLVLKDFKNVVWQEEVDGDNPLIGIGNEILDAFPVQPYRLEKGVYEQQVVVLDGEKLALAWEKTENPPLPADGVPGAGEEWEISAPRNVWLEGLRERLCHGKRGGIGAFCFLDYGFSHFPRPYRGTLQAVKRHRYMNILDFPGDCDLTAHVPFGDVAVRLGKEKCTITDFAPFLLQHGLVELALARPDAQAALQRLLHPAGMGTLFKVLCYVGGNEEGSAA